LAVPDPTTIGPEEVTFHPPDLIPVKVPLAEMLAPVEIPEEAGDVGPPASDRDSVMVI